MGGDDMIWDGINRKRNLERNISDESSVSIEEGKTPALLNLGIITIAV